MLFTPPVKASHQHKNLASFAEAQLCWLSPIPQTKTLPAEWTHHSANSFYLSIPHWEVKYSDALTVSLSLKQFWDALGCGIETVDRKDTLSWINDIFCKSVVHHRGNSSWKEQKMGCGSTTSLCLWIPCALQALPLTSTTLAQPEGRAFLCLDLPKLGSPTGFLSSQLAAVQMQNRGCSSLLLCTAVTYKVNWRENRAVTFCLLNCIFVSLPLV